MNIENIRQRVTEVVGQLSPRTVRRLAAKANVHETVFGRVLRPGSYNKPTNRPTQGTLRALAQALDVDMNWLINGVGARQLDAWPRLVQMQVNSEAPRTAREEMMVALDAMSKLPEQVQQRAYRAAVSSAIDAIASQGKTVPVESYGALVRLDELQSGRSSDAA